MKKRFVKITAATLAILMLATCAVSCSGATKPAMTLGKNSISAGMYSLMASILKGSLAYGNSSINTATFWETVVNRENGQTNEEFYNELLFESAKNNLYKLAIFDERGLTLPQSVINEIDERLAFFVDYDGEGSKNSFNALLAQYGANYDILRDYMIMAAKIEYVVSDLYGNGAKISDTVKQEYLDENYVAFKQILFPYFEYVYETDENGDEIYYVDEESSSISYDPYNKNATTVDSDGDGKSDRDKNGDVIWYTDDEQGNAHICYDKENGVRRIMRDSNGYEVTREYSAAKKSEVWNEAQKVFGSTQEGNFNGFESLMLIYDGNYGVADGEDVTEGRIYINTEASYAASDEVVSKLGGEAEKLEVGGISIYESDYGVHIIMRYETEEKAWETEGYEGYFDGETGVSDFTTLIINSLFLIEVEKMKEKLGEVSVDSAAISDVSIRNVGINYNFY